MPPPSTVRYLLCTRRIAPKTTRNTASNIIGAHQAAKCCRPQAETCARQQALTVRVYSPVVSSAQRGPCVTIRLLSPPRIRRGAADQAIGQTHPRPLRGLGWPYSLKAQSAIEKVTHSGPPRAYPVLMHIIPTDLRHFVPFHSPCLSVSRSPVRPSYSHDTNLRRHVFFSETVSAMLQRIQRLETYCSTLVMPFVLNRTQQQQ